MDDKEFLLQNEVYKKYHELWDDLFNAQHQKWITISNLKKNITSFNFNIQSITELQILLHKISFYYSWIQNFFYDSPWIWNSKINKFYFEWCDFKKWNYQSEWFPKLQDFIFSNRNDSHEINEFSITYIDNEPQKKYKNGSLLFANYKIKKINIDAYRRSNLVYFESIEIHNPILNDEILLNKLEIWVLKLTNISWDTTNIELRNLKIWNLIVKNSNLWNMIFNWVNIWKLTLENVTLNDCVFNWTTFDSYELWKKIDGKKIKLEKLKDNYRQLKFIMDKNGNYTEANKFFEKEMDNYWLSLWLKKLWIWWTLKQIIATVWYGWENKKRWEKLSLLFSEIISEHGTNLIRAILILITFAIISWLFTNLYISFWTNFCNQWIEDFIKNCNFNTAANIAVILFPIMILLIFSFFWYIWEKIWEKNKVLDWIFIKIIEKINFIIVLIILLSVIFWPELEYKIDGISYTFDPQSHLLNLINPLHWFAEDDTKLYSNWESFYFILYKIIYWIILWHLIVAAKRTTKR